MIRSFVRTSDCRTDFIKTLFFLKISELVKSGEYAVIFITEDLALVTEEERAKYKDMPLPAITVSPSSKGSRGYGMANIKSAVERAVGADILFKDSE